VKYTTHTLETAPEAAKDTLATAKSAYGFVPNLLGVMAEAPSLLKGYVTLQQLFYETSFDATEQQVIALTVSVANKCPYCVAAESVVAKMKKAPEQVVKAIREGEPIADAKLEALRRFTKSVFDARGWVPEAESERFLSAGYSKANAFEVIVGIALKTLSNYTNHFADTPVDEAFAAETWSPHD